MTATSAAGPQGKRMKHQTASPFKGEESGNTQEVVEVLTDCDADTVVIDVKQNGPAACHTGNRSCFFVKWEDGAWVEHSKPLFDPAEVYKKGPK
ncbi:MAG: phosphoribosyl-AMP cyclohydrolase [Sulfuritalea sp.]|nr:phosphoribosyl-AMP cyclohydrolase [Sulfuritalea sp.]MDP1984098.1 phosphoribosyl-AMP cyclohydrolase [Sulfuritalea sp.]